MAGGKVLVFSVISGARGCFVVDCLCKSLRTVLGRTQSPLHQRDTDILSLMFSSDGEGGGVLWVGDL